MTRTITARQVRKGDTVVKNDGRRFAVGMVSGPEDPLTVVLTLVPADGGMIQRLGLLPEAKVEVAR